MKIARGCDGRTLGRVRVLGGCGECVGGSGAAWWETGLEGRVGGEVLMERPRRRCAVPLLWISLGGERRGGQCVLFYKSSRWSVCMLGSDG